MKSDDPKYQNRSKSVQTDSGPVLHCVHPNRRERDGFYSDICCYCGTSAKILRLPTEEHGPFTPWIYQSRSQLKDQECPGPRAPGFDYQTEWKLWNGEQDGHEYNPGRPEDHHFEAAHHH